MSRTPALVGALALLVASTAAANGAFPDSVQIVLPSDRPQSIFVATNFGLLTTSDGGAGWDWICEEAIAPFATLFQMGPPPEDYLFAVAKLGLFVSRDQGCSFVAAGGAIAGRPVDDVFPDPHDALHVFALAPIDPASSSSPTGLYESHDGGATFAAPLVTSAAGAVFSGVEVAKSDRQVVYLTENVSTPAHARILRSTDGGQHFTVAEPAGLEGKKLRLAAVDPQDPLRLFLRVIDSSGDSLGLSTDGGQSVKLPLTMSGPMSAFLQRQGGDLLVGTRQGDSYRSVDQGRGFDALYDAPSVRGFGEREGLVYVVADNYRDHFAVGTSSSASAWQPLLRFDQIRGPLACPNIESVCGSRWPEVKATLAGSISAPTSPASVTPRLPATTLASGHGCSMSGGSMEESGLALIVSGFSIGWCLRRRFRPRPLRRSRRRAMHAG